MFGACINFSNAPAPSAVWSAFSGLTAGLSSRRKSFRPARPMRFQSLDARQLNDIGFAPIEMGMVDNDAVLHRRVIRLTA